MLQPKKYFLKTGNDGATRLNILNDIYNSFSKDFLLQNNLIEVLSILEVGGGTGEIACWIAKKVAPHGYVGVIDSDIKQVNIIRDKIKLHNITNVDVQVQNVETMSLDDRKFDIIFCRFLLIHLQNPSTTLLKLSKLLKPKGKLIIEDCIFSHSNCFPIVSAFDRRLEIIKKLFLLSNKNYDIGLNLYNMLLDLGFSGIKAKLIQPILNQPTQKLILPLFLEEAKDSILKFKLSDKEELYQLSQDLMNNIVYNNHHFVTSAQVCQICAHKD